jgi:hypothetical protein
MSVKFTKTGVGSESKDGTELLFEFLDHELPDKISLKYVSELVTNKFVGSLQTSQHIGEYLEPISWKGQFFGQYVSSSGTYITAKERADELLRLKGRVVKWYYEGIKQLVIIKELEYSYNNYMNVEYSIMLQPHDIQIEINPKQVVKLVGQSLIMIGDSITGIDPKDGKNNPTKDNNFEWQPNSDIIKKTDIPYRDPVLPKASQQLYLEGALYLKSLRNELKGKDLDKTDVIRDFKSQFRQDPLFRERIRQEVKQSEMKSDDDGESIIMKKVRRILDTQYPIKGNENRNNLFKENLRR